MIQLLIISKSADLPKSIHVILAAPDQYECRYKPDVESASHLLEMPLFGACLLDADLTDISAIRQVELIRSLNPEIPLIVLSGESSKEWEEEAALKGVDFILAKPVRGTLLNNLFSKIFPAPKGPLPGRSISPPGPAFFSQQPQPNPPVALNSPHASLPALEILRDFSRIFSFSLNLKSFTYQFALKLREITGVNRIAIFLEQSPPPLFASVATEKSHRLQCLCSVGIEPELFEYLTLSTRSGIGQRILKSGRILRRNGHSGEDLFPPDPEVQREFTLLGGQIAIPILDRERAIGVAVLGDRLTGQPFSNEELELLFHLMEELGMAIKSNLLHDHLLANHQLISSVFSQISSGCLVVDRELNVLHANPAFLRFLDLPSPVLLSNLPRKLAGLLYEAAQGGKTHEPFLYSDPSRPEQIYRISIVPFQQENGVSGAMMSVEDFTPVEAARKAELKASNLETLALVAEKFAHEIRNALLPIDTGRQLMGEHREDAEFSKNFESTLTQETRRISRLTDQLLYLTKQDVLLSESKALADLLQEAFAKARPLIPEDAELVCDKSLDGHRIDCHASSLTHAFFELLLNGFQANAKQPTLTVTGTIADGTNGAPLLTLHFRDKGPGFSADVAASAAEPFFTTRNVGVGLGLSVTRKIIDDHNGKLEIKETGLRGSGGIFISLPISAPS